MYVLLFLVCQRVCRREDEFLADRRVYYGSKSAANTFIVCTALCILCPNSSSRLRCATDTAQTQCFDSTVSVSVTQSDRLTDCHCHDSSHDCVSHSHSVTVCVCVSVTLCDCESVSECDTRPVAALEW